MVDQRFDLASLQEQLGIRQLDLVGFNQRASSPWVDNRPVQIQEVSTLMNALAALAGYMRAMRNR